MAPTERPHEDAFGNEPAQLNDSDFVEYLTGTLIPDLIESGMHATAEDFIRCATMIENRNRLLLEIEEIVKRSHVDL